MAIARPARISASCMTCAAEVRSFAPHAGGLPRRRQLRRRRFGREVFAGIDEPIALEVVLLVVELAVAAVQRQQRLVRAALDDLAAFEDEDLIGAANRGQPVRDDERRAARAGATAGRPGSSTSLSLSRLDVASSSSRMRGFARIARAIATRWRWPPESRTPRSPTTVS